jgi:hypothetical protein
VGAAGPDLASSLAAGEINAAQTVEAFRQPDRVVPFPQQEVRLAGPR